MAIYAQERSFYSKIAFLIFFGHLEFKYQKVTQVQSCTKFNLQTFFAYVKKQFLLHKKILYLFMQKNRLKRNFEKIA